MVPYGKIKSMLQVQVFAVPSQVRGWNSSQAQAGHIRAPHVACLSRQRCDKVHRGSRRGPRPENSKITSLVFSLSLSLADNMGITSDMEFVDRCVSTE